MTANPLNRLRTATLALTDAAVTLAQLRLFSVTHPESVSAERLAAAQALARARLASVRGDLDAVEKSLDALDLPAPAEGDTREMER